MACLPLARAEWQSAAEPVCDAAPFHGASCSGARDAGHHHIAVEPRDAGESDVRNAVAWGVARVASA